MKSAAPLIAALAISSLCAHAQTTSGSPPPANSGQAPATGAQQGGSGGGGFNNLPPAGAAFTPPPAIPSGKMGDGLPQDLMGRTFNSEYPLSPEQIRQYRQQLDAQKRASAASPQRRAIAETTRVPITLTPGRPPHVLRLSADLVSTIIITDSTGAPWPIVAVIPGAKDMLDIKRDDKKAPHLFTVAPLDTYASTNLSIWLEGATVPIVMSVVGQQPYVDFMLEMAVQARGPNAKAPSVDYSISTDVISSEQNDILNGITPSGATQLKVVGGDAKAWLFGNKMLLRTSMLLRAPTARRVFSGADGSKVYELPATPVVNMANEGRSVTLSISGFPAPYVSPANATTSVR